MGMTMNDCVIKGKTDVQEKLDEGIRDISKMGEEYREVREQLEDMPGSLDAAMTFNHPFTHFSAGKSVASCPFRGLWERESPPSERPREQALFIIPLPHSNFH